MQIISSGIVGLDVPYLRRRVRSVAAADELKDLDSDETQRGTSSRQS